MRAAHRDLEKLVLTKLQVRWKDQIGTLYGAADFTEGSRAMVSSDTLDVTATVSATAS